MENKSKWKDRMPLALCILIIGLGPFYYKYFYTPKNSLELYQAIHFANSFEDVQKLMLEGYEGNFTEDEYNELNALQEVFTPEISQFTLFDYHGKAFIVKTSPGTERLHILSVEELPEDVKRYFAELEE